MQSGHFIEMDTPIQGDDQSEQDSYVTADNRLHRSYTDMACSTFSFESYDYSRTVSEVSSYSETNDLHSTSDQNSPQEWPVIKLMAHTAATSSRFRVDIHDDPLDKKLDEEESYHADLEMMKERFSKLLLGEDMSGSGKGVCTAVAISNAITNLYATIFGQFKKLKPLSPEKKLMWKREMECLLSVCDYIVDFIPTFQTLPDGAQVEVMESRPRSDICMNLPALQKLDSMLLDILESFQDTEFWYIDEQNLTPKVGVGSFRQVIPHNKEKWWLPVPYVPPCGLSEKTQKSLKQTRKCADQIHKAARAINSSILAEMEVPESYMMILPKNGRASLGDAVYRYMSTPEKFSPDDLLDCLEIKSEHDALDVADRLEASMYVWQHKVNMQSSKSSWSMVKDFMADADKYVVLASRAESTLVSLKQRFPVLSQTALDTCKIQYNRDVGQSTLESYSRVLESLAFNIAARIDDVLYIDGSMEGHIHLNHNH